MLLSLFLGQVQDTPPCIFSRLLIRSSKARRIPEKTLAPFLDIIRFTKNSNSLHHALLVVIDLGLLHESTFALVQALVNPYISIPDIELIIKTLSTIELGQEYESLAESVMHLLEVHSTSNHLVLYLLNTMESLADKQPLFVHKISHPSLLRLMGKRQQDEDILDGFVSVLLKYRERVWEIERVDLKVIEDSIKDLRRKGADASRQVLKKVLVYLLWLVKGNSHGLFSFL
jgi:hypothetical protein